ncbi:MAG: zinc ribbon domain-containing protein [Deltaproteobacteria bacterium]|nr:zinc ribbon domain-containing protein [Deltaproteobacteria bacterium]
MFPQPREEAAIMPVYEYLCGKCRYEFEEMQRITDAPIRKCPKCGKPAVERLISRSSFVLKGSGWYVTDYGRSGSSAPAASEPDKNNGNGGKGNGNGEKGGGNGSSKAEGAGKEAATESKPAAKTDKPPPSTSTDHAAP